MQKTIFITIFFFSFLFLQNGIAQKDNVWNTLFLIKFERPSGDETSPFATAGTGKFISMIEAMNGSEIELKGYIIPLDGQKAQSHFMFSAYPFAACFFCGKAGPESVMEVFMADNKKVEFSEKPITIKGKFKFLPNRMEEVMYQLEFAELVK